MKPSVKRTVVLILAVLCVVLTFLLSLSLLFRSLLSESYAASFFDSHSIAELPLPLGSDGSDVSVSDFLSSAVPVEWEHFSGDYYDFSPASIKKMLRKSNADELAIEIIGRVGRYFTEGKDLVLLTEDELYDTIMSSAGILSQIAGYDLSDYDKELIHNINIANIVDYNKTSKIGSAIDLALSPLRAFLSNWFLIICIICIVGCIVFIGILDFKSRRELLGFLSLMLIALGALLLISFFVYTICVGVSNVTIIAMYTSASRTSLLVAAIVICVLAASAAIARALLYPSQKVAGVNG